MANAFFPSPIAEQLAKLAAAPHVASVAEEALADAQAHCPVDTGELRDSLHIEELPDGGKRIVVGTDHWVFPEFGTSEMPAQPFMRPVIDDLGLHR